MKSVVVPTSHHNVKLRGAELEVKQSPRHTCRSSYTFRQLLKVAVDGVFFQSTVLLRLTIYLGFLLALLGLALAAYALLSWVTGNHLPQWTALPMFGLFLAAFIIVSGGVTGLYVGKIFDQVKGRPLFVVDEIIGGEYEPVSREARVAGDPAVARNPDAIT